ncbi:MAG: TonB-linked outer membrane protein SusC/RagA [Bacteroidetes bacterium]|nr:MAG: TonB-linked outer membrane protein SusC/RagA [Bacteroidota bacterium]
MRKLFLLFCLVLGLTASSLYGQDLSITGTVTSQDDGLSLPGVTVAVKGTSIGTTTDVNGKFSIRAAQGAVLQFSFVGMVKQEVTVGQSNVINVSMASGALGLDEVVVTALGIKREKKSLGYALQDIQADELISSRESNVGNALTGKVAGLQVIRSSNGPAGSSKIILRGQSSLTGDNQPLIVVDGLPLNNFTGRENNDYWNPSLDMGSGIGDINPDDIESISVLKGASAAALYGSRAGNGVILITTKKGARKPGLGITFSSTFGTESAFIHPEMQDNFGQGVAGEYDNRSNLSWGPAITGQTLENWNGVEKPLAAYDNVGNFFDRGTSQNYNLSFQQEFDNTSVFTSLSRSNDKSIIPGAELTKTNLTTRAFSKFGNNQKWSIDAKVQYMNAEAKNRPLLGHNYSNPFFTMYLMPRSLDITEFENSVDESGKMIWYGGSNQINPYWTSKYAQNTDSRDRFLLYSSLKHTFNNWLSAEINAGSDIYTTNNESKRYSGSPIDPNGNYSMGKETFFEHNFSTLFTAKKDNLFSKVGATASVGGNIMDQEFSSIRSSSGELEVPNLFALNNGKTSPTVDERFYQKRILSAYGTLQLNWDGYLFVDGSLRNDWSSTLSEENRSFVYPSVSASFVVTDMLEKFNTNVPAWITFARVRASVAKVGNSLNPYELYNTYRIGNDPLGNTTGTTNDILFDPNVQSELITSRELGADIRFFNNRLGFDFTWYKSNATNQLLNLPMDPLSGYRFMKINAGDIQNKGIELMAHARILENSKGLNWAIQFNYSKNKNTVEELTDEIETYQIGGFDNMQILAETGQDYGMIYGTSYLRVEDETSEFFGQMVLDANGLPLVNPDPVSFGSQQPNALMGITNTLTYKGIAFSFMFDGRFGGYIFSQTNQAMQLAGTAAITAPDGQRNDLVVSGVIDNGDGTYRANDVSITREQYWTSVAGTGNLGITEANVYDATNVRLRYINLSYDLPRKLLAKTPVQGVKVGMTMNNVWLIKSNLNGVDPESVYATGTNALGFENAAPPSNKTFLFNLSVSF